MLACRWASCTEPNPTRSSCATIPTAPIYAACPNTNCPICLDCIRLNEQCGRLTNPACRTVGIAVNTSHLPEDRAAELLETIERQAGLPAVDPLRQGAARLVDAL